VCHPKTAPARSHTHQAYLRAVLAITWIHSSGITSNCQLRVPGKPSGHSDSKNNTPQGNRGGLSTLSLPLLFPPFPNPLSHDKYHQLILTSSLQAEKVTCHHATLPHSSDQAPQPPPDVVRAPHRYTNTQHWPTPQEAMPPSTQAQ
jgi:hypothetical protein